MIRRARRLRWRWRIGVLSFFSGAGRGVVPLSSDGYGVPRYLSAADRFAMKMGGRFSAQFPGVVIPVITSQLRKESSNVILPAEDGKLRPPPAPQAQGRHPDEHQPVRGGHSG